MQLFVEIGREDDGRWIAEIPELAGVMVYGLTREAAVAQAKALAFHVLADRLDRGEISPDLGEVVFKVL